MLEQAEVALELVAAQHHRAHVPGKVASSEGGQRLLGNQLPVHDWLPPVAALRQDLLRGGRLQTGQVGAVVVGEHLGGLHLVHLWLVKDPAADGDAAHEDGSAEEGLLLHLEGHRRAEQHADGHRAGEAAKERHAVCGAAQRRGVLIDPAESGDLVPNGGIVALEEAKDADAVLHRHHDHLAEGGEVGAVELASVGKVEALAGQPDHDGQIGLLRASRHVDVQVEAVLRDLDENKTKQID